MRVPANVKLSSRSDAECAEEDPHWQSAGCHIGPVREDGDSIAHSGRRTKDVENVACSATKLEIALCRYASGSEDLIVNDDGKRQGDRGFAIATIQNAGPSSCKRSPA